MDSTKSALSCCSVLLCLIVAGSLGCSEQAEREDEVGEGGPREREVGEREARGAASVDAGVTALVASCSGLDPSGCPCEGEPCGNKAPALQMSSEPAVARCGDGVVNGDEECDGSTGLGLCPAGTQGPITCTTACQRDTSGCVSNVVRLSPACAACTDSNCSDLVTACHTEANLAQSPAGACDVVLACAHAGWDGRETASCAKTNSSVCYCGTGANGFVDIGACLGGTTTGDCNDVIRAQSGCAGSDNEPQCILARQNDTDYGYGDAMQLINCQRSNCFEECALDP